MAVGGYVNYFFGNARNERGLCATPDCTREPVQTCVFKYCDECFDQIMRDLAEGRTPNLVQMQNPEPGTEPSATEEPASS
jgi:hypothetical protein